MTTSRLHFDRPYAPLAHAWTLGLYFAHDDAGRPFVSVVRGAAAQAVLATRPSDWSAESGQSRLAAANEAAALLLGRPTESGYKPAENVSHYVGLHILRFLNEAEPGTDVHIPMNLLGRNGILRAVDYERPADPGFAAVYMFGPQRDLAAFYRAEIAKTEIFGNEMRSEGIYVKAVAEELAKEYKPLHSLFDEYPFIWFSQHEITVTIEIAAQTVDTRLREAAAARVEPTTLPPLSFFRAF